MEGKKMARGSVQATINLRALLDTSGMKGAISSIQKSLSGLSLPKDIDKKLIASFSKIEQEFLRVEQIQAKETGSLVDAGNVLKSGEKILKIYIF